MLLLKGKTALVTGASRGIGRAISIMLAKNGINLALNSRCIENLKNVEKEVASHGVNVLLCPADLADAAAPAQIINRVVKYFGGLDILINNAGVAIQKPLADTAVDEWDLLLAINARAPFLLCREAIPYLKKSEAATIINIGSVVSTKGYINQGAYTAAKHALMGMTKVLAQELYDDNIRVHIISPGGVATELAWQIRPDLEPANLIAPEEIAAIVLFLLTHRGNAVIDEISVRRASNRPWK